MFISDILEEKHMSKYRLAKLTNIAYSTISDLCDNRSSLNKCNVITVYKIAKALNVTIDSLLEPERIPFESFKSNVCHELKRLTDINFINKINKEETIYKYFKLKWYPECLYLVAMIDYLCRVNNLPLNEDYDELRKLRLEKPIYPSSVLVTDMINKNDKEKKKTYKNSIPEFSRFNIIESEVRDVY